MAIEAFSSDVVITFNDGFWYANFAIPDPPSGKRRIVRHVSGGLGVPVGQVVPYVVIGSHRYLLTKSEVPWDDGQAGFQFSSPTFDILEGSIGVNTMRSNLDGTNATTGDGLGRIVITGEYIDL
jgi:hypothetical protein